MKKTIFYLALGSVIAFSFRPATNACSDCELFKQGVQYTTTAYDANGKVTSTNASTVNKITTAGDNTSADITTISTRADGKGGDTVNFQITCTNDKIMFDLKSMMMNSSSSMAAKGMTMTMEGSALEYPNALSVGTALADGLITMTMNKNGAAMGTTVMKIYNRKVAAQESKTTAAGTFDCYKISQSMDATTSFGTMKFPTQTLSSTEWFCHKDGMIRNESYDSKGKLMSYYELTSIKMP